jgi:hypothetical protein
MIPQLGVVVAGAVLSPNPLPDDGEGVGGDIAFRANSGGEYA